MTGPNADLLMSHALILFVGSHKLIISAQCCKETIELFEEMNAQETSRWRKFKMQMPLERASEALARGMSYASVLGILLMQRSSIFKKESTVICLNDTSTDEDDFTLYGFQNKELKAVCNIPDSEEDDDEI